MATNEGKSDLFFPRELNSFETGLLLVRSARGGGLLGPAGLHMYSTFHRKCEEKTGALLGGGG